MVEDLIFSKVNIINVEETNAAIERYKQNNSDIITINQMRRNEDIKKEFSAIKEEEDLKRLHDAQFHVGSTFIVFISYYLISSSLQL